MRAQRMLNTVAWTYRNFKYWICSDKGEVKGHYIVNPKTEEEDSLNMFLTASFTKDAVVILRRKLKKFQRAGCAGD